MTTRQALSLAILTVVLVFLTSRVRAEPNFSLHALKDPDFAAKQGRFIAQGKPVLLTDGLAARLRGKIELPEDRVHILKTDGEPKKLLDWSQADTERMRQPMLQGFGISLLAPSQVALYLFQVDSWVLENFRDVAAEATLNGESLTIPARGWKYRWK
jgi:hypothetical protein